MKLIRRSDNSGLLPITDVFDHFFDPFFGISPFTGQSTTSMRVCSPMDIAETEKDITIKINVPGYDPEQVKVDVHGSALTIKAHSEGEKEEKGKTWHRKERFEGSLERQVELPNYVDGSKATCKVKNGVLTVIVPKKEEASPKSLRVDVE